MKWWMPLLLLLVGCCHPPAPAPPSKPSSPTVACAEPADAWAARVRGKREGLLRARQIVSRTTYGRAVVRRLIDQEVDRLPKMAVEEFHVE